MAKDKYIEFLLTQFTQRGFFYHLSPKKLFDNNGHILDGDIVTLSPRMSQYCLQKNEEQQKFFPEFLGDKVCVSLKPEGCFVALFGKNEVIEQNDPLYLYVTQHEVEAYRAINTNEADCEFYLFEATKFVLLYELLPEDLDSVRDCLFDMTMASIHVNADAVFYSARHNVIKEARALINEYDKLFAEGSTHPHFYTKKKI